MKPIYTDKYFLAAGETNAEQEMSLPLLATKLIDIATEHAIDLKIGNPFMPNVYCGWVLSRLTIEMNDYPSINTDYAITTWVESWNRHFSERAFRIEDESGKPFGYARSVWMVLDTRTRANAGMSSLNLDRSMIAPLPGPEMKRQTKHFPIVTPAESEGMSGKFLVANGDVKTHTFLYSDLDAYRHVNTVRYVQLLMNQFSLGVHDEYIIERIELSFLREGEYGKTVEILKSELSSDQNHPEWAISLRKESNKEPILFSRIRLKKRAKKIL